jgi:hypothetical protein
LGVLAAHFFEPPAGGLLPRPPPEGLFVVLGPFGGRGVPLVPFAIAHVGLSPHGFGRSPGGGGAPCCSARHGLRQRAGTDAYYSSFARAGKGKRTGEETGAGRGEVSPEGSHLVSHVLRRYSNRHRLVHAVKANSVRVCRA